MFPAATKENDFKIACLSLQETEVFCPLIYDEYEDEVDQISISNDVDLISNQPIYDSYRYLGRLPSTIQRKQGG